MGSGWARSLWLNATVRFITADLVRVVSLGLYPVCCALKPHWVQSVEEPLIVCASARTGAQFEARNAARTNQRVIRTTRATSAKTFDSLLRSVRVPQTLGTGLDCQARAWD